MVIGENKHNKFPNEFLNGLSVSIGGLSYTYPFRIGPKRPTVFHKAIT